MGGSRGQIDLEKLAEAMCNTLAQTYEMTEEEKERLKRRILMQFQSAGEVVSSLTEEYFRDPACRDRLLSALMLYSAAAYQQLKNFNFSELDPQRSNAESAALAMMGTVILLKEFKDGNLSEEQLKKEMKELFENLGMNEKRANELAENIVTKVQQSNLDLDSPQIQEGLHNLELMIEEMFLEDAEENQENVEEEKTEEVEQQQSDEEEKNLTRMIQNLTGGGDSRVQGKEPIPLDNLVENTMGVVFEGEHAGGTLVVPPGELGSRVDTKAPDAWGVRFATDQKSLGMGATMANGLYTEMRNEHLIPNPPMQLKPPMAT